jgi:hypothetical protein
MLNHWQGEKKYSGMTIEEPAVSFYLNGDVLEEFIIW